MIRQDLPADRSPLPAVGKRSGDRTAEDKRLPLVLAIDLGSTWCKAAYVDSHGRFVDEGRSYSRIDTGEGSAERIWGFVMRAVRAASANRSACGRPLALAAIGISCRGVFGVALDARGDPVDRQLLPPPAAASEVEAFGASGLRELDGYGYAARLATSALRLRQMQPATWSRVRRFGALHDWALLKLSGAWLTDPATGPGGPAWPEALAELSGLPREAFPSVRKPEAIAGGLTVDAARDLGLREGIRVVVGSHDGAAANLGAGAFNAGDACLTLGSNVVLRVVTREPIAGWFGYPIVEGRWAWVRGAHGLAAQLDAVVASLDGVDSPVDAARHAALTCQALTAGTSTNLRLPVLPLGAELRQGTAASNALREGHSAGAIYRAALEGVAGAALELLKAADRAGAKPESLAVTGGAAANPLLLRLLGETLQIPIRRAVLEAGLLGAALLAACGAGWYADLDSAAAAMLPAASELKPTLRRGTRDSGLGSARSGAVSVPAQGRDGFPGSRGQGEAS